MQAFLLRLLAIYVAFSGISSAANLSFTGNLTNDDEVQFFTFTLSAPATVTLRTYSYAGGTNSASAVIPSGGFDPILALFDDSTGALINQNDDGGCSQVPPDPVTGNCWDTYLQVASLPAGNYRVAVTQYDNFAIGPNLSNGFEGSDAVNFNGRTNAWAFDILNVDAAAVVPNAPQSVQSVPTLSEWGVIIMGILLAGLGYRTLVGQRRAD